MKSLYVNLLAFLVKFDRVRYLIHFNNLVGNQQTGKIVYLALEEAFGVVRLDKCAKNREIFFFFDR